MILLINQFSTPLFVDVVNAFQESGKEEVTYFTGKAEIARMKINPKVRVLRSVSYNRTNLPSRFFTWMTFTVHVAFHVATATKPSAIVVVTNPPFAPWVVSVLAKWRAVPFYLVVYDLYPDVLVQAGLLKTRNPVYRLWQKINSILFARARKVFTLSESMKAAVARYLPGADQNIVVIHNWADATYIAVPDRHSNPFVVEHKLDRKLVVLYAGNMGLTHDLESLMQAAVLLKENDGIHFVFVGNGGKRRRLEEIRDQHNLGNVLFLPFVAPEDFPYVLAAGDIGVVTLGKGAEGISVPSKTYVSMAAGLCLLAIAPEESELARIVKRYDAGVMIEPNNPVKVAGCILHLNENRDVLERLKACSRQASQHFTSRNAYRYVEELKS
jgi:glycosyltransferase involved in cell wall biosynthesis